MNRWLPEWMHEWMKEYMHEQKNGWMNRWMISKRLNKLKSIVTGMFQAKITDLEDVLAKLTADFEKATAEKIRCQEEADNTQRTIQLANRLVGGLASENVRWAESVQDLKKQVRPRGKATAPRIVFLQSCSVSSLLPFLLLLTFHLLLRLFSSSSLFQSVIWLCFVLTPAGNQTSRRYSSHYCFCILHGMFYQIISPRPHVQNVAPLLHETRGDSWLNDGILLGLYWLTDGIYNEKMSWWIDWWFDVDGWMSL